MDFAQAYKQFCSNKNLPCLNAVLKGYLNNSLTLDVDLLGQEKDWDPLLKLFKSSDHGLEILTIHSQHKAQLVPWKKTPVKKSKFASSKPVEPLKWKKSMCRFIQLVGLNSKSLASLKICGLKLDSNDCSHVAASIASSTSIRHLSLEGCLIGTAGLRILEPSIKTSPSLTWLSLNKCALGNKDLVSMCETLKLQMTIRVSYAWTDSLRQSGIKSSETMKRLDFAENSVDDGVISELSDVLQDLPSLTAIDLRGNKISDNQAVINLLTCNTQIFLFDLRRNEGISAETLAEVDSMLLSNIRKYIKLPQDFQYIQRFWEFAGDETYKWFDEGKTKRKSVQKRTHEKLEVQEKISFSTKETMMENEIKNLKETMMVLQRWRDGEEEQTLERVEQLLNDLEHSKSLLTELMENISSIKFF